MNAQFCTLCSLDVAFCTTAAVLGVSCAEIFGLLRRSRYRHMLYTCRPRVIYHMAYSYAPCREIGPVCFRLASFEMYRIEN